MFFLAFFSISCNERVEKKEIVNRNSKYYKVYEFWEKFVEAMSVKNSSFLIENSLDTINCCECLPSVNSKDKFSSKFILDKYINKVMHVETLKEIPFSVFETDTNTYKITYHITSKNAPNGTYSLFYTVVKENGEFLFSGMLFQ